VLDLSLKIANKTDFCEEAKNVADPSGLTAACQGDDESFENSPAIGGNDFGDLIEKMIEFHVRLLGLSEKHEEI
jgi:hypothetical protein